MIVHLPNELFSEELEVRIQGAKTLAAELGQEVTFEFEGARIGIPAPRTEVPDDLRHERILDRIDNG